MFKKPASVIFLALACIIVGCGSNSSLSTNRSNQTITLQAPVSTIVLDELPKRLTQTANSKSLDPIRPKAPESLKPSREELVTSMMERYAQTYAATIEDFNYSVMDNNPLGFTIRPEEVPDGRQIYSVEINHNYEVFWVSPPEPSLDPKATVSIYDIPHVASLKRMYFLDSLDGVTYRVDWEFLEPMLPIFFKDWLTDSIFFIHESDFLGDSYISAFDIESKEFLITIYIDGAFPVE